jgi:hypothetical protein
MENLSLGSRQARLLDQARPEVQRSPSQAHLQLDLTSNARRVVVEDQSVDSKISEAA